MYDPFQFSISDTFSNATPRFRRIVTPNLSVSVTPEAIQTPSNVASLRFHLSRAAKIEEENVLAFERQHAQIPGGSIASSA